MEKETKLNKPEPKKIKMPPLVDRSKYCDTMDWNTQDLDVDENYQQNNSESVSELESL
jgi:hypothetical protein